MKKLIFIGIFLPQFAFAQGEMNNNPPSQQAMNAPVQNVLNADMNDNAGDPSPQNDAVQQQGNENGVQKGKGGKEPYCKECEEIKKLKKEQMAQHISSGVTSGNGKTKHNYFRKFCVRTSKKLDRAFVKHKKNKPDYSCFNW